MIPHHLPPQCTVPYHRIVSASSAQCVFTRRLAALRELTAASTAAAAAAWPPWLTDMNQQLDTAGYQTPHPDPLALARAAAHCTLCRAQPVQPQRHPPRHPPCR